MFSFAHFYSDIFNFCTFISLNKILLMRKIMSACFCFILSYVTLSSFAQNNIAYTRHDTMIPMRDGVKLYTVYYTPNNVKVPVPILIMRTPYGSDHIGSPAAMPYLKELAAEGYIFVI